MKTLTKMGSVSLLLLSSFGVSASELERAAAEGESGVFRVSIEKGVPVGNWTRVKPGVWVSHESGAKQELAFGVEGRKRLVNGLVDQIDELMEQKTLTAMQQARLIELNGELDAALVDYEAAQKLVSTSSESFCNGWANFEMRVGFLSGSTVYGGMRTTYDEFPPYSGDTATVKAKVKINSFPWSNSTNVGGAPVYTTAESEVPAFVANYQVIGSARVDNYTCYLNGWDDFVFYSASGTATDMVTPF